MSFSRVLIVKHIELFCDDLLFIGAFLEEGGGSSVEQVLHAEEQPKPLVFLGFI